MFCSLVCQRTRAQEGGERTNVVQPTTNIDRTGLDHAVDDFGERSEEVGRGDFGVEEDLGSEEALVSYVDLVLLLGEVSVPPSHDRVSSTHLARNRMLAFVHSKELLGLLVVLAKLLDHVSADITVVLLDLLRHAERVFRRDRVLSPVSEELLDEGGDVAASNGDVADRGADNVAFRLRVAVSSATSTSIRGRTHDRDNVGNSVSRVDNGPREGAVRDLGAAPACG